VRGDRDVRERRIYNWITYPTFLLGLVLALAGGASATAGRAGLRGRWSRPRGAGCSSRATHARRLGDVKLALATARSSLPARSARSSRSFAMLASGLVALAARSRPGRALLARLGVARRGSRSSPRPSPRTGDRRRHVLFRLWQRLPQEPPV